LTPVPKEILPDVQSAENLGLVEIRPERPDDFPAIREIIAATMRTLTADLVDLIRDSKDYIPQLSRMAVTASHEVVCYVMLSRVKLEGTHTWSVLSLPPLAVRERLQRSGVGSALVHDVVRADDQPGELAVVFLGHAAYYPRFGFVPARKLGIEAPWHSHLPDGVWMALPLAKYAPEMRGTVLYPPAYTITESVPPVMTARGAVPRPGVPAGAVPKEILVDLRVGTIRDGSGL
jgi:predicted N-acetyltransferase YhbS